MNDTDNSEIMSKIPDCSIDTGIFKYIQATIKVKKSKESKRVIRGFLKYEYHKENYEDLIEEINKKLSLKGLVTYKVNGGGRINHDSVKKTISVYGYSQSYGLCNHSITTEILKSYYPDYEITWSNEGY